MLWTILLTQESQLEYFDLGFASKLVARCPSTIFDSQPNQFFFFFSNSQSFSSDSHEHCGYGGCWRGHGRSCSDQWPFTFTAMNFPSNPNLVSYGFYSCQNFEPPLTSHGLLRPAPMNMFSQSQLSLLHDKFTINMAILLEISQPDVTLLWV